MNTITTVCPICDVDITLPTDVQVSEVITCSDCKTKLVVETIEKQKAVLAEAPKVEEDWGE